MERVFIFDAGSTKTALAHNVDGLNIDLTYPGYNPNRPNNSFLETIALLDNSVFHDARVYFYGSGLRHSSKQEELKIFFKEKFQIDIELFDDVLGAARALFNRKPGAVAIMGTGASVAYYDGNKIVESNGGHGYLIDDIGGGYELGKILTSYWLNGQLNEVQEGLMAEHYGVSKEDFTAFYYKEKNLDSMSQVVHLINDFKTAEIESLLIDYFTSFLKRHVISLLTKHGLNKISIVGTIGEVFAVEIRKAANANGIQIESQLRFPAVSLLNYHIKN